MHRSCQGGAKHGIPRVLLQAQSPIDCSERMGGWARCKDTKAQQVSLFRAIQAIIYALNDAFATDVHDQS